MALTAEVEAALEALEIGNPDVLKAPPSGQNTFVDLARAGAQGLTFGFADEIEATVRAALDADADYADVVAEVRKAIDGYREREPAAALGAEIAGSVIPMIAAQFIPGAGQAATAGRIGQLVSKVKAGVSGMKSPVAKAVLKSPVAKAALTSGAQGAVYGAGVGEGGLQNRLESAAQTAAISAVGGGAISKFVPRVTEVAKGLVKRGVPLTPGQAVRGSGLIGRALASTEEKIAGTVPFIGDAITAAFERSKVGFNRAVFDEALAPIKVVAPKGKEGRELIRFGQDAVDKAYDDVLDKMSLTDDLPFYDAVLKVANAARKDISEDIMDASDEFIFNKLKDNGGKLAGNALKDAHSKLRKAVRDLKRGTDDKQNRLGESLQDILSVFDVQLGKQNTAALAKGLNNVDQAYGTFEILRKASIASVKDAGDFTPGQLLGAVRTGDPTKRKSQFSRGEARLQETGQQAQDVIGQTVGQTGTAPRNVVANIASIAASGGAVGGGLLDLGTLASGALGGASAYSPLGVYLGRNLIDVGGRAMQQAVPVLSANIGQLNIPEGAKEMLSRALLGSR
tara:strand:+ start:1420 stop:3123 length:1704 start_codon:yes stop_codon:yes gene_type:complete